MKRGYQNETSVHICGRLGCVTGFGGQRHARALCPAGGRPENPGYDRHQRMDIHERYLLQRRTAKRARKHAEKAFCWAQCLLMPGQAAAADYCALMLTFCSEAACEKEFHAQTGRGEGSSPSVSIRGCAENDLDGSGWHVEELLRSHDDKAAADCGDDSNLALSPEELHNGKARPRRLAHRRARQPLLLGCLKTILGRCGLRNAGANKPTRPKG